MEETETYVGTPGTVKRRKNMCDKKDFKQKPQPEIQPLEKKHINPGDIIGKIDVNDTRERRDGPGGN